MDPGFVPRPEKCRDKDGGILSDEREVIERWKQHYEEHLNGAEAENQDGGEDFIGTADEGDVPAPTTDEVKDATKRLKNLKAADKDGIGAKGVICLIYKKVASRTVKTIERSQFSTQPTKCFPRSSFNRLSPLANRFVGSYQAGFVKGRSTTDQIFTLRQILQKCREWQVPTHHLFIDFNTAYDTIDRGELWKIVHEHNFPKKLTRLIKATVNSTRCCVKISGALLDPFETRKGLRQGDGNSCLLFNIALEGVIRRAGFNMRGTIFSKTSQFICYADDEDIVGRRFDAVAEQYTVLKYVEDNVSVGWLWH